jgi:truncated hemoglobin YjbI
MKFPAVTSFYCTIAVEDQLSAIYEVVTEKNADKLYKYLDKN